MDKSKQFFQKSQQGFQKSKQFFQKSQRGFQKSQRGFQKSQQGFRRRLSPIKPGARIDYRNLSLMGQFISERGKILSRRVTKLTLKQQRLMTIAIKQARILSSLPFLYNAKLLKKIKSRNRKKYKYVRGAGKQNPRRNGRFFEKEKPRGSEPFGKKQNPARTEKGNSPRTEKENPRRGERFVKKENARRTEEK